MSRVFLALLFFGFCQAQADVIFIDMNNAPLEIAAAERGAASRNPPEQVWKIPDVDPATRAKQESAQAVVDDLSKKVQDQCSQGAATTDCQGLRDNLEGATKTLSGIIGTNRMTPEKLKAELAKLSAKGVKASSVIISGHDGNGRFSGSNGRMDAADFDSAFSANPRLVKDVRSLLLWGCYTTSLGSIDGHWRDLFPNVAVFAGFDGRGPSKLRDWNFNYMQDFLAYDKSLAEAGDKNAAMDVIRKIRGFDKKNPSAICAHDCIFTPLGNSGVKCDDVAEIRQRCSITDKDKASQKIYDCFREAVKPECGDPPKDTDNSPIRPFMVIMNDKSNSCSDYWNELGQNGAEIPRPEQIQSLLFYKNEKLNLGILHRTDLERIDSVLRKVGAPGGATVSDLPQMTRAQIKTRLADLQAFLDRADKQGINHPQSVELDYLRGNITELSGILVSMDRNPEDWIEPTSNPDMALRDSASTSNFGVIRTQHEFTRLQINHEADRALLLESNPRKSEFSQVDANYRKALRDVQNSTGPEKKDKMATLSETIRQKTALQKQMDRDISAQMIARVKDEMNAKQSTGQLTPEQSQAYARYLKILGAP